MAEKPSDRIYRSDSPDAVKSALQPLLDFQPRGLALEDLSKMIDECLLDVGKTSLLRVPFDGPYPFSGKVRGAVDACPHGPARSVRLVNNHHTGMANADTTAELRAAQIQVIA